MQEQEASTDNGAVTGITDYLVTCEHGGNRIPQRYRQFFGGFDSLLHSHRGYDLGALNMANELAATLRAPLFACTTSRLLIDLNRPVGHPRLYSKATRHLPLTMRREILERYYLPVRNTAEAYIAEAVRSGKKIIHFSSHSFTPELDGQVRNADIGLLYDPSRPLERDLCNRWRANLKAQAPCLAVRRNYPYLGKANGFAACLRRRFPADAYIGIELEINQKHFLKGGRQWEALRSSVCEALKKAISVYS
ncbi:Predicted N-formylglutamate amidohydrolase [Nitrosospira briensis]|uniref:Predicted N-formylglutamate amidohydrolase n=1 Tax=Nitrosospira briensis TaxID=35799 RepID=A0A1I4XFF6_9PROT|nr:Predicted N-formylglutamate amidohydrolase [Nitrosospira briensis]